jgi:hypothetical protein
MSYALSIGRQPDVAGILYLIHLLVIGMTLLEIGSDVNAGSRKKSGLPRAYLPYHPRKGGMNMFGNCEQLCLTAPRRRAPDW